MLSTTCTPVYDHSATRNSSAPQWLVSRVSAARKLGKLQGDCELRYGLLQNAFDGNVRALFDHCDCVGSTYYLNPYTSVFRMDALTQLLRLVGPGTGATVARHDSVTTIALTCRPAARRLRFGVPRWITKRTGGDRYTAIRDFGPMFNLPTITANNSLTLFIQPSDYCATTIERFKKLGAGNWFATNPYQAEIDSHYLAVTINTAQTIIRAMNSL